MTKKEILDYIIETPGNTNRAVLGDMLDSFEGGSGGGGGAKPLIIHVTEEEVKDPQTQKKVGYKTDVLASDAYEAWQSGRPIYFAQSEDYVWLVSSVSEHDAFVILKDLFDNSLKVIGLAWIPISDGYLILEERDVVDN